MKSYDNHGNLVAELDNFRTSDDKTVSTITTYNTYNGRVISQQIQVWDGKTGTGSHQTVIGGKILP